MPILPQTTTQDQTYGVIYVVTNRINGKQYVGQTTRPVRERWAEHVRSARVRKRNECHALNNAIRKYGSDAFGVKAVIACDSQEELDQHETITIEAGGTLVPNGYNLKTGGGNGKPSAETRAKISAATKRSLADPEVRVKMSEASKRRYTNPEERAKMGAAIRLGLADPEVRVKIGAVQKGKTFSPEYRAKISAALKGKTFSSEHRARLSEAKKGKTLSLEHRAKISEANKRRFASLEERVKISKALMGNQNAKGKPIA